MKNNVNKNYGVGLAGEIETDGSDYGEVDAECRWWRAAATTEELAKLKATSLADIAALTPRLKVMRELERLAMAAREALDDLRHRLMAYRAGDLWVPTGGLKKEEVDVPVMVSILLVGFSGGGKSSLVNLMYSVLGRAGITPFAQTSDSESTTLCLEEHNVLRSTRAGFCIYDSRGYDYNDRTGYTLIELSEWMTEGVHHNQPCPRPGDEPPLPSAQKSSSMFVKRQVNCAMVVANMAEIYSNLMAGETKHLEATRDLFCFSALKKSNQNPILILTHGDKLSAEERIDSRLKICDFLGISEASGVYDIVCLTEYGVIAEEYDPVTSYALTEAVYRALLISDMTYLPKRYYKDKAIYYLAFLPLFLSAFFAFLARFLSNLSGRPHILKQQ